MVEFILASRSPRRRALIKLVGYSFQSIAADVDESSITNEEAATNVMLTAQLKANAIATQIVDKLSAERTIIVAADTTVALDGNMLGKPIDKDDAWYMLRALRGRTHEVLTGITLLDMDTGKKVSETHTAVVTMRKYSDNDIAAYIATGDPMDKAGAYAIQHPEFQPVARLDGCYTGVMGLSVCHLIQTLLQLNVPTIANLFLVHKSHKHYYCPLYQDLRTSN
jgi:MAF protein